MLFYWSNQKNEGLCFDNEGTARFSCTCTKQFAGERCENDLCKSYPTCQNNGTCIIDLINAIPTPRCECYGNTAGTLCDQKPCSIPCYNSGICNGETCKCSQENGIAKYYGESCDLNICELNLCQNGGTCSTSQLNTQVRFTRNIENFSFYQIESNIRLKP